MNHKHLKEKLCLIVVRRNIKDQIIQVKATLL
jgi:hypothetical protein